MYNSQISCILIFVEKHDAFALLEKKILRVLQCNYSAVLLFPQQVRTDWHPSSAGTDKAALGCVFPPC